LGGVLLLAAGVDGVLLSLLELLEPDALSLDDDEPDFDSFPASTPDFLA
jgi:hypothetical protein